MERRANQSQKHIRSIRRTVLLAKKLLSHFKYFISLKKVNIENKVNKKSSEPKKDIKETNKSVKEKAVNKPKQKNTKNAKETKNTQ